MARYSHVVLGMVIQYMSFGDSLAVDLFSHLGKSVFFVCVVVHCHLKADEPIISLSNF